MAQDDKIEALEAQLSDALEKLGQSLTSQARSVSTAPATNNLEEWVLAETEIPHGTRLLVDQATQYVYSNPRSAREWPQPLGPLTPDGQVLENRLEQLMSAWSRMLKSSSLRCDTACNRHESKSIWPFDRSAAMPQCTLGSRRLAASSMKSV